MLARLPLLLIVLSSLLALPARATDLSKTKHAIKLDGGFASATGFGGINYVFAPVTWLQIETGVGYGFSGFQLQAMPKLVLGNDSDRFVAGIGPSFGFGQCGNLLGGEDRRATLWLNIDALGYERRFSNGLSLSMAVGWTVGLAGRVDCGSEATNKSSSWHSPQGRVSVGYWF